MTCAARALIIMNYQIFREAGRMQTKTKGILKLSVVFALVALIAILGLTGSLRIGKYRFHPFSDFLKPGLDLGGGVVAELAATRETADEAVSILRKRLSLIHI